MVKKKNIFNNLFDSDGELEKALIAYLMCFLIMFVILIFVFKKSFFNSLLFSLVLSQIFLNIIFLPTKYNIYTEMSNSSALYIFIQFITPVIVYIYVMKNTLKK